MQFGTDRISMYLNAKKLLFRDYNEAAAMENSNFKVTHNIKTI